MKLGDICGHCKLEATEDLLTGYGASGKGCADPCLGMLPGVRYACCGHGKREGYILFENETAVRIKKGTVEDFSITSPMYADSVHRDDVPHIKLGKRKKG